MKNKKIVMGIVADVDAGKTTLSEEILYEAGIVKVPGRVDHGDAFFDNDEIERRRGITVFAKETGFSLGEKEIVLIDTPGHRDFKAEVKRSLSVLDLAIILLDGTKGISGYSLNLFKELESLNIPTIIFVNKTDLPGFHKETIEERIGQLTSKALEFQGNFDMDSLGVTSERAFELFEKNQGMLTKEDIGKLIEERNLIPVVYGAALKGIGSKELFKLIEEYLPEKEYGNEFSALVYKVSRDQGGQKISHLKITGGSLANREEIDGEKITSIKVPFNGIYEPREKVEAGDICLILGLSKTYAGEGLGTEKDSDFREPKVLTYELFVNNKDYYEAFTNLKAFGEEHPELDITFHGDKDLSISLYGKIQMETVKELLNRRYDLDVEFGKPKIQYMETIEKSVKGCGHYEPLKHYAEVHLMVEPLVPGEGIIIESNLPGDDLDFKYQNAIVDALKNHKLKGVLTGSPVTDIKISVIAGKGHLKHTEGGDFREATLRAFRQALMKAKSILLEPVMEVEFRGEANLLGRISSDVKKLKGEILDQTIEEGDFLLSSLIPLSTFMEYQVEYLSITGGKGIVESRFKGFKPCHNVADIIEEYGYQPTRDVDESADSVFCIKGGATLIPWNEADSLMHIKQEEERNTNEEERKESNEVSLKELEAIFAMTFGKKGGERRKAPKIIKAKDDSKYKGSSSGNQEGERHLMVDGYNVIFRWPELKELAEINMDAARESLISLLANYGAYSGEKVTVVFDAYNSKEPGPREMETLGITVVFTGENETADAYIEREAFIRGKKERLRVATSDRLEQMNVFASGALRISSLELKAIIEDASQEIRNKLNG